MKSQLSEPSNLDYLYAEREKLQKAIISPATVKGYDHDWKHFRLWCEGHQRAAMPATADTLSLYLTDLLFQGKKVVTASRCASAVAWMHRHEKQTSPLTDEVRSILWGARRLRIEQPRQMVPITVDQVRQIACTFGREKTPTALRDRAIVVLGFASALRRSNLASLKMEDVEFRAEGVTIHVRREKQDPAGHQRRVIAIPFGNETASCPVRCLRAWLRWRGEESGPVFTRLDHPKMRPHESLSGNTILKIVKYAIASIGVDAEQYGPHSLRAGLITEAGQRGVSPLVIASQSGHRSLDSLQRYFRPTDAFRSNACAALGL